MFAIFYITEFQAEAGQCVGRAFKDMQVIDHGLHEQTLDVGVQPDFQALARPANGITKVLLVVVVYGGALEFSSLFVGC